MNYDKIEFTCDAVENEFYATGHSYLTQYHKDLKITVIINDVRVNWNNHVCPYELMRRNIDSTPRSWRTGEKISQAGFSWFQPFTCSCGDAGCAGIWDGIFVKPRKHSVEWRAKKEDGYGFLEKTYFNFERTQYKKAFEKLLSDIFFLSAMSNFLTLVVDPGYCEEGLVTGLDFWDDIVGEIK